MSQVIEKSMAYVLEQCPYCGWNKQRPLGRIKTSKYCPSCDGQLVRRIFKATDSGVFLVWDEKKDV